MQHFIFVIDRHQIRHIFHLVRQYLVVGGKVFVRRLQLLVGQCHQFGDGAAAAHMVSIEHIADTGAVKGVARLDQRHPCGVEVNLFALDLLRQNKTFPIPFQGVKEQTAGCELQYSEDGQHHNQRRHNFNMLKHDGP